MWAHLKTHCFIALSYPSSVAFHFQSLRVFLPLTCILGLKCYVQQQSTMPGWPVFWSEGVMGLSGFLFPHCSNLHCSWLCSKCPGRDAYPVHGQVGRSPALPPFSGHPRTPCHLPSTTAWEHGTWGHALSSARQDGEEVWPIWKYFIFYKCSALEMDFFSLGTVTRTPAEQEQLAEKTNRATMCFQQCSAVTCLYRTLGSCSTTDMSCIHVTP